MQGICENIRTAIEHGRTDIIRSLLDACTYLVDISVDMYLGRIPFLPSNARASLTSGQIERDKRERFHLRAVHCRSSSAAGENGNSTEGITRDKILNQPLLEEGTFLSYASKVCDMLRRTCRSAISVFFL